MQKKTLITNYLKPSIYVRSFMDVNINSLKDQGIKLMISDLDNTLVPHYTRFPNKDVMRFIAKLKENGIKFAIISNNLKTRVSTFAEKAGVGVYRSNAKKPFKRAIVEVMKEADVEAQETIFMGDQIVMDILVANRVNCESILVQPLVSTDYKMSKLNMLLEKLIYERLEKNNILQKGRYSTGSLETTFELL